MLNKETQDKLKVLGFDVSKLTEAIKAEDEQSLEVPTLYTEEQKKEYGDNRYEDAKPVMKEILAKEYKEKFSLDLEGKDLDKVFDAYAGKKLSEAKVKPDEKVKALQGEKEELQNKINNLINQQKDMESEYQNKLFGIETKTSIMSKIPDQTIIPKEDIAALFLNSHNIEKDNGRTVVKKDGKVLKDEVLNPLDVDTVLNSFIDSRNYVKKEGMGGGDRNGGGSAKFANMTEFYDYCKKNEVEPLSKEGQSLLAENKTENFNYKQ